MESLNLVLATPKLNPPMKEITFHISCLVVLTQAQALAAECLALLSELPHNTPPKQASDVAVPSLRVLFSLTVNTESTKLGGFQRIRFSFFLVALSWFRGWFCS